VDLADVLWIGGPQGTGKSSVARALAYRFDLQLYLVDHRVWVHEPRMPATEFGSLSLEERWVTATPERMIDWFVTTSRHRLRLVLEDLRELPALPGAVVEGPQLFPTSVAAVLRSPGQALFLLPTAARRHENDVLATQVRLYAESLLPTVLEDRPLAFACECGASGCTAELEPTLEEYEAVSAAGDRSRLRRPTP
jgi:hypothetical protein